MSLWYVNEFLGEFALTYMNSEKACECEYNEITD